MRIKILKIFSIAILFIILFGLIHNVNADMGRKPSITIKIKNLNDSNYIIDLLTVFEKVKGGSLTEQIKNIENNVYEIIEFSNDYDEYSTDKKNLRNEPIYLYHNNGWMATAMRDGELWGSVIGNENYVNSFYYLSTPRTFKIILQLPNGELKVSEQITRLAKNSIYTLDANTMEVTDITLLSISTYIIPIFILSITIVVEICIGLAFFKTNRKKTILIIFLTNFLTNSLLQITMSIIGNSIFLLAELIIMIVEAIIYMILLKDSTKKRIILYSLIANFATMLLTYMPIEMLL